MFGDLGGGLQNRAQGHPRKSPTHAERRTPRSPKAAKVVKSLPTSTLTGVGATARTTAAMSSSEPRRGA